MKKISFEPAPFIFFYAISYMAMAIFSGYLSLYYRRELSFNAFQIGIIASIGPMVSMAAQPLWGILSDRTNRRRVLMIIIGGAAVTTLLFPLHAVFFGAAEFESGAGASASVFLFIGFAAMLYTVFSTSINPLSDTITLQFVKRVKIKFSTIRLVGTVSYAVMIAVVGRLLNDDVSNIFYINSVLLGMALFIAFWMPRTDTGPSKEKSGMETEEKREALHEGEGNKTAIHIIFKNKILVGIFLISFVLGLTLTFYHTFITLHMDDLGANTGQIGFSNFIAASSEIPVLLVVNRFFAKRKPVHLLMITGIITGLRMMIFFSATTIPMVYAGQLLHGFHFMLPYYFTVLLLDQHAPPGLRSTTQSIYAVFRGGAAALLGSIGGGFLADALSIQSVFLLLAVISFTACFLIPGIVLLVYKFKNVKSSVPK